MDLHQLEFPRIAHLPLRARIFRNLLLPLAALALMFAAPAGAFANGVYVAGQGVTLTQALSQALAENAGSKKAAFWVVVAGDQIKLATKKGTSADVQEKLKTVLARGGQVYACRSDMAHAGIKDEDLLEGVISMYGYSERDWSGLLPARPDRIQLPQDMKQSQLILKTCAGEPKQGA